MMKFLRSQSQTVLVVVLGVIGLGFLFYGNSGNFLTSPGGRVSNDFGRIDGEDLTVADLTDAVRNTRYALLIGGHAEQLRQPGAAAAVAEEAWRQLLLLHEADRLHIYVSDRQVVDKIRSQPIFQKDGVYSPAAYENAMGMLKIMLHVQSDGGVDAIASTQAIFETVIRNDLRIGAVSEALFSSVRNSAHDVSDQYQKYYGPVQVSVVTFDPKPFIAAAQVTPEQIEAEYKAHPGNPAYRTQEKRKVDYVLFLLTPDQAKLPDVLKKAGKNALGQKALDFALALQPEPAAAGESAPPPPDFLTEAKKRNLTPGTTDFFTVDTPPANLPPSPAFNNAAFSLTKDDPTSKVIELDNGVAVLHLEEIQPSELRPLEEVKADIIKNLQQSNGLQAEQLAAQNAADKLKSEVAKGADFKAAATALNLKVETLPSFVPIKAPTSDARLQTIAEVSASLTPGQVSGPVPVESDNSTIVIHLDSRSAADPAGLVAFETRFREANDEQLRALVRADWTNWKSKQPGTHKPPELDAYGGVE
ncbi:MAG: SurA N-terminal domain-containing protein [Methylacidiphilales bacterium]|nr:SurA N-terminal domain-containing protein [Candidatus Methylacidiphilales bacterium]